LTHPVDHSLSQLPDRFVANRFEEGVAISEVPVGRVGDDSDHSGDLPQNDRVRPARANATPA